MSAQIGLLLGVDRSVHGVAVALRMVCASYSELDHRNLVPYHSAQLVDCVGGFHMAEIKELLPHRDPFLFVDRLETVSDERIVGYRTFTDKEPFFTGHFPGYPLVPGVILVETMAQCGGAGIRQLGTLGEKLFFLATVEKAKFRRQVRPNDEVRMEIENIKISHRMIKQSGKAFVGDEVAAEAEWMCLVGDAPV